MNLELTIGLVLGIGSVIAIIIYYGRRAHRRQAATGREELIGKTAIVKVELSPEGTVFHKGELWTAVLDKGQAEPGEEVTITKFDSMKLYVTKKTIKEKESRKEVGNEKS